MTASQNSSVNEALPGTARAVRFDRYGDRDVLEVRDVPVPVPEPGPDEVLVAVRAAGINPGEAMIREDALDAIFPATFPSGEGTDFSGDVLAVGDDVHSVAPDQEVLGYSWNRSSHATHVVVPAAQVVPKPAGLSWEVAGSLNVAGTTAWAVVGGVKSSSGETVVVAGATGGVGSLVVQPLREKGVRVLGIASARSADWLREHGVVPVAYGEGLVQRIQEAAPEGVDAFIDLFGEDYPPPGRRARRARRAHGHDRHQRGRSGAGYQDGRCRRTVPRPGAAGDVRARADAGRGRDRDASLADLTRWRMSARPSRSWNGATTWARSCCCPRTGSCTEARGSGPGLSPRAPSCAA